MHRTVADCRSAIVAGLIALLTLAWSGPAAAERRVALVIGNSAYQSVARLELSDRLYEHNFDPEPIDSKNGMKVAISEFQAKTSMTSTGEATEGLLMRLRKLDDLKPWGSIVYGPDSDKWGISWDYASRREAVAAARVSCGSAKCPIELSFYGKRCGAFAISGKSWSLIQRDTVQRARGAALDECGKTGGSCRIIGAVCADGFGR